MKTKILLLSSLLSVLSGIVTMAGTFISIMYGWLVFGVICFAYLLFLLLITLLDYYLLRMVIRNGCRISVLAPWAILIICCRFIYCIWVYTPAVDGAIDITSEIVSSLFCAVYCYGTYKQLYPTMESISRVHADDMENLKWGK